ncbi:uncharacterized protein METZ01_LOCUS399219, partial [marine metagenome]
KAEHGESQEDTLEGGSQSWFVSGECHGYDQ